MKRRVVAIVLSLTMCMGGTLEAGAAALSTPDVQVAAETNSDSAADSFSDEEETVQQPQTDVSEDGDTVDVVIPNVTETPADTADETPDITETPDVTETPDITETPDATETPEEVDPAEDFNAGDADELQITSADSQDAVNSGDAAEAASTGASVVNGVVEARICDWVSDELGYRLRKEKVSEDKVSEAKTTEDQTTEDQADEQTDSVSADTAVQDETEAQIVNDSEAQTGDAAETAEDVSLDNGEAVQADSDVPSGADTATVEEDFFTAQDGLLKIRTNGHTGYYLFNEDGYLVTGRMTREPGTAGYTGTKSVEWYFWRAARQLCILTARARLSHHGHPIWDSSRGNTGCGQEVHSVITMRQAILLL